MRNIMKIYRLFLSICLLVIFDSVRAESPPVNVDQLEWVSGVAATLEEQTGEIPQPKQLVEELNFRAIKLYQDGKYLEAIELARRTWTYAEQKLGGQHHESLAALINLGTLLHIQGQSPLVGIRRPGKPGPGPARDQAELFAPRRGGGDVGALCFGGGAVIPRK